MRPHRKAAFEVMSRQETVDILRDLLRGPADYSPLANALGSAIHHLVSETDSPDVPYRFWRYRWRRRGGHVHVRAFVGFGPDRTLSLYGTMTMDHDDWSNFRSKLMADASVEFMEEHDG